MTNDDIKSRRNKKLYIVNLLRHSITSGKLAPGDDIPTRDELLRRFRTSKSTVQAALAQLASEGFVRAHGAAGTRVVKNPPHLNRFGLLLPIPKTLEQPLPLFWETLKVAASSISEETENEIVTFYIGPPDMPSTDYQKAVALIQTHSLAGIISAGPPFLPAGSFILQQREVVAATIEPRDERCPAVFPDFDAFYKIAVRHLHSKGRSRIGILYISKYAEQKKDIINLLRELDLEINPYCVQDCSYEGIQSARGFMHLMMSLPPDKKPNGLIIADDNLVLNATAGLMDAQVEIPADLEVVAHCNYPLLAPDVLPFKRLGFDCKQILEKCIELIKMQKDNIDCRRIDVLPKFREDMPEKRKTYFDFSNKVGISMPFGRINRGQITT